MKLYTFKVAISIKTTNPSWIDAKKHINCCMNCGIVNELTDIKSVTVFKPIPRKKKGKAHEQTKV